MTTEIKSLPELPKSFDGLTNKLKAFYRRRAAVCALKIYIYDSTISQTKVDPVVLGYDMGFNDCAVSMITKNTNSFSNLVLSILKELEEND